MNKLILAIALSLLVLNANAAVGDCNGATATTAASGKCCDTWAGGAVVLVKGLGVKTCAAATPTSISTQNGGDSLATNCLVGYGLVNGVCTQCTAGNFALDGATTACTACPDNQGSGAGEGVCVACTGLSANG